MGGIQNTIAIPIYRVLPYPVITNVHNLMNTVETASDIYIYIYIYIYTFHTMLLIDWGLALKSTYMLWSNGSAMTTCDKHLIHKS